MMRCTMVDREVVTKILQDDSVFIPINGTQCKMNNIADELLLSPITHVLMPVDGFVAIFIKHNQVLYTFHVAALPEARGQVAIDAGKKAFEWMFQNTDCMKIFSFVPALRTNVVKYMESLGMVKSGTIKKSIVMDCELEDQEIMEF